MISLRSYKHLLRSLLLVISALFVLANCTSDASTPLGNPYYLGVVAPNADAELLRGVEQFVEEANAEGGVSGRPIELVVRYDNDDTEQAVEAAQSIVDEGNVFAVIGHNFSSTSLAAAPIYEAAGIPVVSASATADIVTQGNDWYFRVIFNNSAQSIFLANYAYRILNQETASIIYTNDTYGSGLRDPFVNTFQGLNGDIAYEWELDVSQPDEMSDSDYDDYLEDQIRTIIREMRKAENGEAGAVYIAGYGSYATDIIVNMRRLGLNNLILGADAIGSQDYTEDFASFGEEQVEPGVFTTGIYATTPLIFDVANSAAAQERSLYIQKFNSEPGWSFPMYYDAANLLVDTLRDVRLEQSFDDSSLRDMRDDIRDALRQIDNSQNSFDGISGSFYFNQHGDAVRAIPIGRFDQNQFISALVQMQPIGTLEQVNDLDQAREDGEIVQINEDYYFVTNIVYTGLDLLSVSNLDERSAQYTLDFYLWFRTLQGFDIEGVRFSNAVEPIALDEPITQRIDDNGMEYRLYRISADFEGAFHFGDYPFDKQELVIELRHETLTRDRVIFVVDLVGMRESSSNQLLAKFEENDVFSDIANWTPRDVTFSEEVDGLDSTLGDPQLFDNELSIDHSSLTYSVTVRRNAISFMAKNLLPELLVIVVSYIIFFLPPEELGTKIGIGINTLLTTAFFLLTLSGALPEIGYIIAIEWAFYAVFVMALFQIIITIISFLMYQREKHHLEVAANVFGAIVYPLFFVGVCFIYIDRYDIFTEFARTSFIEEVTPEAPEPIADVEDDDGVVTLRFATWRPDADAEYDAVLDAFNDTHPNIEIVHEPTTLVPGYVNSIPAQLEVGVGPDMWLTFGGGFVQDYYRRGYAMQLNDLADFETLYAENVIASWSDDNGDIYGLPIGNVMHGVYYNQEIFDELGLSVPQTWDALLETAQIIKAAGYVPFANTLTDQGLVGTVLANHHLLDLHGGRDGLQQYWDGDVCFNSSQMVELFENMAAISPYLIPDSEDIGQEFGKAYFYRQEAAMIIDGSWIIPIVEQELGDTAWSVFDLPATSLTNNAIVFDLDHAVTVNADTEHWEEVQVFLNWMMTEEGASAYQALGFFTPIQGLSGGSTHPQSNAFLRGLLSARSVNGLYNLPFGGEPNPASLMQTNTIKVINDEITPQEAADAFQAGMGQWYEPAQLCRVNNS